MINSITKKHENNTFWKKTRNGGTIVLIKALAKSNTGREITFER